MKLVIYRVARGCNWVQAPALAAKRHPVRPNALPTHALAALVASGGCHSGCGIGHPGVVKQGTEHVGRLQFQQDVEPKGDAHQLSHS